MSPQQAPIRWRIRLYGYAAVERKSYCGARYRLMRGRKKTELVLVKLLYKMKDVTDKPHEYTFWSLADSHSHISLHTILKTRPSIWASDVQRELVLVKGAVMPCFRSYGLKQLHSSAKPVFILQLKEITHWEFFIDVVSLQPSRFVLSFVQSEYL